MYLMHSNIVLGTYQVLACILNMFGFYKVRISSVGASEGHGIGNFLQLLHLFWVVLGLQ